MIPLFSRGKKNFADKLFWKRRKSDVLGQAALDTGWKQESATKLAMRGKRENRYYRFLLTLWIKGIETIWQNIIFVLYVFFVGQTDQVDGGETRDVPWY